MPVTTRARQERSSKSSIKQEGSIHISNLQLVDPVKGGPTRIGYRFEGDKKVRYAKKSGEEIK